MAAKLSTPSVSHLVADEATYRLSLFMMGISRVYLGATDKAAERRGAVTVSPIWSLCTLSLHNAECPDIDGQRSLKDLDGNWNGVKAEQLES